MTAAASATAAGWGKALLPTYLAGTYGLLQRSEPIASLRSEVWLLYHQDLRSNPRVRAFSEFAAGWLRSRLSTLLAIRSLPKGNVRLWTCGWGGR